MTATSALTARPERAPSQTVIRTAEQDGSWRSLPAQQQPRWPDEQALAEVTAQLQALPPLVVAEECFVLRDRLARAAEGAEFVLMGGDCAETFDAVTLNDIRDRVRTVLQMSAVLAYGTGLPVIKIGRLAGQYGKPRSAEVETRDGLCLPVYRGDIVNNARFTPSARTPDPGRLTRAYFASAATLNLVRALAGNGYADMRRVVEWNAGLTALPSFAKYARLVRGIEKSMRFMAACGSDFDALANTDFYAGHEALVLDYESALLRSGPSEARGLYASSGHFLWIGERTRQRDGAHIAFAAAVQNPVGIKVGPSMTPDELLDLIALVNPDRLPGRLTLITRMGADRIGTALPPLLRAVDASGHPVVWVCDPMHGNTVVGADGRKTRHFEVIMREVEHFFAAHRAVGTVPGGVHVELTGTDVTECVGGAVDVTEHTLAERYFTACDPRLNHAQSVELALLLAELLEQT